METHEKKTSSHPQTKEKKIKLTTQKVVNFLKKINY